jgi:hypothetical protein
MPGTIIETLLTDADTNNDKQLQIDEIVALLAKEVYHALPRSNLEVGESHALTAIIMCRLSPIVNGHHVHVMALPIQMVLDAFTDGRFNKPKLSEDEIANLKGKTKLVKRKRATALLKEVVGVLNMGMPTSFVLDVLDPRIVKGESTQHAAATVPKDRRPIRQRWHTSAQKLTSKSRARQAATDSWFQAATKAMGDAFSIVRRTRLFIRAFNHLAF